MNDKFDRIWKEVIVALMRYYPGICLQKLRKVTINLSQDSWCPGRDSNGAPPEYRHCHK
jgi:hypothetical protein